MPHPSKMSTADTGLLVIDVQDKLTAKIPGAKAMIANIAFLIDCARLLDMPVQATEQYPRGLGPTVADLARRLPERMDKVAFSCCAVPAITETFQRAARPKILLAGIETHVCVQQTALDLLTAGFRVHVAADAVASRYVIDHDLALRRLAQTGVVVTSAEAAAFEWVGTAASPKFKEFSRLVQERMKTLDDGQTEKGA